ncbi:MAG TPA: glycosyltransferase family 2 protein [Acidimicrobiales bacterium]
MSNIQDLAFSVKSALIAARPREARINWQVAAATDLRPVPGGRRLRFGPVGRALGWFPPPKRRTDEIWAVTMVRDEADVIRYTVEHLLAEGVDRVLVADNGSVDGTGDLLRDWARADDLPITVVDDTLAAYHQSAKMTRLARCAASAGAAWVIPFDADELWYSPDGRTLAEVLRTTEHDILAAPMWNQLPAADDVDDPNPYVRLRTRTAEPLPQPKVAFRAHHWARVAPGNHTVRRRGRRATLLGIRQVPFRTPEQIERKYRNGAAAVAVAGIPDNFCYHWRELAALPTEEMLERVFAQERANGVVVDPPPFRSLRPATRV